MLDRITRRKTENNMEELRHPIRVDCSDRVIRDTVFRGNGKQGLFVLSDEDRRFTNWTFENCILDGVAIDLSMCGAIGANGKPEPRGAGLVSNVKFVRCDLRNVRVWAALRIAGVNDVIVDCCLMEDCGIDADAGDIVKVTSGSRNVRILNTTIRRATRDGVDLFDASGVSVVGCTIEDCGAVGIDAKAMPQFINDTRGHRLTGNRIGNCGSHGINLINGRAVVSENFVTRCQYGIFVADPYGEQTSGQIVVNNNIWDNREDNLAIRSHSAIVSGNIESHYGWRCK